MRPIRENRVAVRFVPDPAATRAVDPDLPYRPTSVDVLCDCCGLIGSIPIHVDAEPCRCPKLWTQHLVDGATLAAQWHVADHRNAHAAGGPLRANLRPHAELITAEGRVPLDLGNGESATAERQVRL